MAAMAQTAASAPRESASKAGSAQSGAQKANQKTISPTAAERAANDKSAAPPAPAPERSPIPPVPRPTAGPVDDRALAEKMFGSGRVTPDRLRNRCAKATRAGEIVVCGSDDQQYRVQSTADADPTGRAGTDDGRLHAPDVAGNGIFKGKALLSGRCFVPPCPPEAAYMIDLSSIPIAPAGSDADKIAKGELRAP